MERMGICYKCREYKMVRDHHYKGYNEEYLDETAPYCYSCDRKAHIRARKEGRCLLSSNETHRLSNKAHTRKYERRIDVKERRKKHRNIPEVKEANRITCKEYSKKNIEQIQFIEILMPNVKLHEILTYNNSTGSVGWSSAIRADHKKELYEVEIL